jgi:hypothetical protein
MDLHGIMGGMEKFNYRAIKTIPGPAALGGC